MRNVLTIWICPLLVLIAALGVLSLRAETESLFPDGDVNSELYSPIGKRDPFKPPSLKNTGRSPGSLVSPLDQFSIEQLQLKAVLRGMGPARAMFEDPTGITHILSEGMTVGREGGKLSRILNTEVIITERTLNYLGVPMLYERVLSLPNEE